MEVTNAVGGATAATILYGLIAFGGTLTLLDNLGLYDDDRRSGRNQIIRRQLMLTATQAKSAVWLL